MLKRLLQKKTLTLICVEVIVFLLFAVYSVTTYSQTDITFSEGDMQLQGMDNSVTLGGGYLDTSYDDKKAVVTPAFRLKKGIYHIEAVYAKSGIVRAGLIYDETRNGKELVDDNEFALNMENDRISYRAKIHDDSAIRFKLRLTGDAVDGDYIHLLQVHVISSKLTYIYSLFCMAFFFLVLDLLYWGYLKYYRKWDPEQKIVFLILVFMAFFIGLPLYQNGMSTEKDLTFHLCRLEGIYQGLASGQFPVRIQPGWLDGYGYAASIFYGDIFLYFPAVLRMVGFTLQDAYKWYAEAVNITTVFISFYAFKRIARNNIAAVTGTVLYAGSVERLSFLYRGVLGNYSAMMFYPLVVAGFYLVFTEDEKSSEEKCPWMLLTLGFTGLLMTHMISCLMWGVLAVFGCLIMIRRVFRRSTVSAFIKAAGLGILLNLWFLVPFIQYMLTEKLKINTSLGQKKEISDYYAYLENFRQSGKNIYSCFVDPNGIGYAVTAVLLIYMITMPIQKKDTLTKRSRVIFGISLFGFWLCTNLFPVVRIAKAGSFFLKFFTIVQVQYRFTGIAVVFLSCLAALFFAMKVWDCRVNYIVAGVLCCITLYQDLRYFETVTGDVIYLDIVELDGRMDKHIYSYNVGNAEYLPIVTITNNITKEIEKDDALQLGDVKREYLTYEIAVNNATEQEREILLPLLYYSGYQTYDMQSKEELKTSVGDNGRVMVTVPGNYCGIFQTAFHIPWYWRISEIISLVTLCFILYYLFQGKEYRSVWRSKKLQILHSVNTEG